MILVVDTNIVLSSLLKDSKSRELLIATHFKLIAPDTMITEIRKYEKLILEKSGLNKEDYEILLSLIIENIEIFAKEEYELKLKEAENLINLKEETGDFPFLALALSFPVSGIWTEDKHFNRQNKVKIWKTIELIKETDIIKK